MFGLTPLDFVILLAYLLGVTVLGVWVSRTVKNMGDYFLGGRKFGHAFMMMHNFATSTHSTQAVVVASRTYSVGLSGIWYH